MGGGEGFYRGGSTDGHKSRRFYDPMWGVENTSPSMSMATVAETVEGEVGGQDGGGRVGKCGGVGKGKQLATSHYF